MSSLCSDSHHCTRFLSCCNTTIVLVLGAKFWYRSRCNVDASNEQANVDSSTPEKIAFLWYFLVCSFVTAWGISSEPTLDAWISQHQNLNGITRAGRHKTRDQHQMIRVTQNNSFNVLGIKIFFVYRNVKLYDWSALLSWTESTTLDTIPSTMFEEIIVSSEETNYLGIRNWWYIVLLNYFPLYADHFLPWNIQVARIKPMKTVWLRFQIGHLARSFGTNQIAK